MSFSLFYYSGTFRYSTNTPESCRNISPIVEEYFVSVRTTIFITTVPITLNVTGLLYRIFSRYRIFRRIYTNTTDNQYTFKWSPIISLILAPIPGPTPHTPPLIPYLVGPGIGAKLSDLTVFHLKVFWLSQVMLYMRLNIR